MKFAICNELFEGWPFDRVCRYVKSVGYDGVEIAPFTLAPSITDLAATARAELRAQADDAGVQVVGLHWLLARTAGLHLTSPDRDVRQRTARYLVALADLCHALGGRVMVFGSPQQRALHPGVSRSEAVALAAETFRLALPRIADLGVFICMEPLTPHETDFITTVSEAVELIDEVGHPAFVLHLDVRAMSSEGTPVPELIRRYAPRAGHLHVNDPNGRGPGFGSTDFAPILEAVDASGYDRWVSVEVFDFTPDPETVASRSLEYLHACRTRKESWT